MNKFASVFSTKCSIKDTSYDKEHGEYMTCDEQLQVVDFDSFKDSYKFSTSRGKCQCIGCHSCDALLEVNSGEYLFIEFKNGENFNSHNEIASKYIDSILLFFDAMDVNPDYSRRNINFLLVAKDKAAMNIRNKIKGCCRNDKGKKVDEWYKLKGRSKFTLKTFDVVGISHFEKNILTNLKSGSY